MANLPADLVRQLRTEAARKIAPKTCLYAQAADLIERLCRGEFICKQCGLRKDGEKPDVNF